MKEKYLLDDPHWKIGTVKSLDAFFGALLDLVPESSVLCLGEGDPDKAIQAFFQEYALPNSERISLIEFMSGQYLQINKNNLKELQRLADCHAAPEIATHIAVSNGSRQILEWFDVPFDPITVSLEVSEERLMKFCSGLGVKYLKEDTRK